MKRRKKIKGQNSKQKIILRIYHEFEERIDKSVPRVSEYHHEALPSDTKQ